ncbi:acetyl-CoA carboxylase carboxyltransferase subunit alpha [Roseospirillum parvum]|uniref:Acetyl-coenzyme A carboxylase carboxyl transferase subunit alpha n=1 Tax=Roseospirillum parvum TaxID=83401 RepID=A0A1G8EVF3_9PROT|nr:acetyl-CoA carboxylase carboxyltransferase subunit alpha [Roseospirillum parvum]SDH73777.1 acetyl-CoA carboxylase carboxyl transferase subunit alpha [Roseospirillum parvum]
MQFLEFEKPIAELEGKIEELRHLHDGNGVKVRDGDEAAGEIDLADDIARLREKVQKQLKATYAKLTPWQKTQVARHPLRPHGLDVIHGLVEDFTPLAGDRAFAEDRAIVGGLGRFNGRTVMVMAHEKGRDTDTRLTHNFGMAKPEGYRKAIRLMRLAERFGVPVITLVDTAGAYPGVEAEERGQAEAIARAIETCLDIRVPLVTAVIGEGGSGGAIALAAANRVLMFEHAIYSVISPEGCAGILWRSGEAAQQAAEALRLTAQDLLKLGVIDAVVPEPLGGAHRTPDEAIANLGLAIEENLKPLLDREAGVLRAERRDKFLAMGRVAA